MSWKKWWNLRNKVIFKHGKQKFKVKHAIGLIIAVVLLIYAVPTQFAVIRDGATLSVSLDEMKLSKNIRGIEEPGVGIIFPEYADFSAGTIWNLGGGTSYRLDPDHEDYGLPDLQMNLHDFSVSEKDETDYYNYDGYRVKATRHYVEVRIKLEVEGREASIGGAYDETNTYRYEDMLLYVRLSSSGLIGITDGSIIEMNDGSEIDLDRSYCRAEDSITIDSLSGNPDAQLSNSARFKVHINEVWWNGGGRSYTANIKVKIPLVFATQEQVTTTPPPPGPGGNGGNGGYTPPPLIGGVSNVEMILAVVIIGIMAVIVGVVWRKW